MLTFGCQRACIHEKTGERRILGETMGTYYSVIIAAGEQHYYGTEADLKAKIDKRLSEINDIFSTYRKDSIVSQFNQSHSTEKFVVGADFVLVVTRAQEISQMTDGAFNIAIDALIDLWGFDKSGRIDRKPSADAVAAALKLTDVTKIHLDGDAIHKDVPTMAINLSAIAKGFAVDDIARLLSSLAFANFMVEIGGEIVTYGHNSQGKPWVIGIEDPKYIGDKTKFLIRIGLSNRAVASSGTYLNFFTDNGVQYSHIIDPRTGYPVKRDSVSITVIAPDCMTADALATAFMVLGEKASREVVAKLPDVGAMFVSEREGEFSLSFVGIFDDNKLP